MVQKHFHSKIAFLSMYTRETFHMNSSYVNEQAHNTLIGSGNLSSLGKKKKRSQPTSWSVISPLKSDLKSTHTNTYTHMYVSWYVACICGSIESTCWSLECFAHLQSPKGDAECPDFIP